MKLVVSMDDEGKAVEPQPEVELRDYGHGSTPDEDGALYELVEQ